MSEHPLISNPSQTRQASVVTCAVVSWALGSIFVALRMYTRRVLLRLFALEDWLIILAFLSGSGFTISIALQVYSGTGRHLLDVEPDLIPFNKRAGCASTMCYTMAIFFTKMSTLLLYSHIFKRRDYRMLNYALMVAVVVSASYSFSICVTVCVPVVTLWNCNAIPDCQGPVMWLASLCMHIATDFLIVLLPLPAVAMLKSTFCQKLVLMGIFLLGLFVSIASIMRMHSILTSQNPDFSYYSVHIVYWTSVEVNLAIICPCAMTLRPLASKIFRGISSTMRSMADPSSGNSRSAEPVSQRRHARASKRSANPQHVWERFSDSDSDRIILQQLRSHVNETQTL